MPYIFGNCDDCKETVNIHFEQCAYHCPNGLWWWQAYRCEKCGAMVEADGGEYLPDILRNMILREEGTWSAELPVERNVSVSELKAIRYVLKLTIAQMAKYAKSKVKILSVGTQAEMTQIQFDFATKSLKLLFLNRK